MGELDENDPYKTLDVLERRLKSVKKQFLAGSWFARARGIQDAIDYIGVLREDIYRAEHPDEVALIEAAAARGIQNEVKE